MYEIKLCRICKSKNLKTLLDLGTQRLSEFLDIGKVSDSYPLELVICENCHQVQLKHTLPQKILYTDNYGYRSGVNETMRNHLKEIVNQALFKVGYKQGHKFNVCDIGSNEGTLLKAYPESLNRYGYDLVAKFAKDYDGTGITFKNEPFRSVSSPMFKIITAISMFYDLHNPKAFLLELKDRLDKDGIIVIQQNYLLTMLQGNGFENIGFEHLMYYSLSGMIKLCDMVGLEVFDVYINDLNGGSFRTYIGHKGVYTISNNVSKQVGVEREYGLDNIGCYEDFVDRVISVANRINDFVRKKVDEGKTVALCAASTRGNTLLQTCGITKYMCRYCIERNPEKYGKVIASVGIPIVSEEDGLALNPDYLLVLPYYFKVEFLSRYKWYMERGGKMIFPLPSLEVIGANGSGLVLLDE